MKKMTVFVANDAFSNFKEKFESWKTSIYHQYFKTFLMRRVMIFDIT